MSDQTQKRVVFSYTATPEELKDPKRRKRLALFWEELQKRRGKDPRNSPLLCIRAKYGKLRKL